MTKILYLMSIDWGWIVQRPHFLALQLEKKYETTVICKKPLIKRWKSQKELREPKRIRRIVFFPLFQTNKIVKFINGLLIKKNISDIDKYDVVYVGSPEWVDYLIDFKGKIIYDCMDDYIAFSSNDIEKKKMMEYEKKIVEISQVILASSDRLKNKLEKNYSAKNVFLVRNGIRNGVLYPVKPPIRKNEYVIGYIGTIASWMDFETLNTCLDSINNVYINMIGPVAYYPEISNRKISFLGVIEHNKLYEEIKEYDCLIMPFIVNEIVLSVDPVKLYEYIAFGLCIISIRYPEVERFGEFVYFYDDVNELVELISELSEKGFPPKYDRIQQERFINNNTWESRLKDIEKLLADEVIL